MANTIAASKTDYTRRRKTARFQVTLSGAYTQNAGEVLDFTNFTNPGFEARPGINGNPPPVTDFKVPRIPGGYTGEIVMTGVANPSLANAFALKLYSAANTELAAGAYPAALLTEPLLVECNVNPWTN